MLRDIIGKLNSEEKRRDWSESDGRYKELQRQACVLNCKIKNYPKYIRKMCQLLDNPLKTGTRLPLPLPFPFKLKPFKKCRMKKILQLRKQRGKCSGSEPWDFLDRKSADFSAGFSFFMLTEFIHVIKNVQGLPRKFLSISVKPRVFFIQNYDLFPRVQIQSQIRILNLSRSGFKEKWFKLRTIHYAIRIELECSF